LCQSTCLWSLLAFSERIYRYLNAGNKHFFNLHMWLYWEWCGWFHTCEWNDMCVFLWFLLWRHPVYHQYPFKINLLSIQQKTVNKQRGNPPAATLTLCLVCLLFFAIDTIGLVFLLYCCFRSLTAPFCNIHPMRRVHQCRGSCRGWCIMYEPKVKSWGEAKRKRDANTFELLPSSNTSSHVKLNHWQQQQTKTDGKWIVWYILIYSITGWS